MKRLIISLGLLFQGVTGFSQGLEKIIVEKYYISDANDAIENDGGILPVGSVTYRIYADMLPGYKFQAGYGVPKHELRITTSTYFFNNIDRGASSPNGIAKTFLKNNTVMLDSWLSTGAASTGNFGILKADDSGNIVNSDGLLQNADPKAGIPLKTVDGLVTGSPVGVTFVGITNEVAIFDATTDDTATGQTFSTSDGSWAALGGAVGPTADNRVLIAQITTAGTFSFELNIQIGTPGGDVENYVAKNPEAGELTMTSLTYPDATANNAPTVTITSPANAADITAGDVVSIKADAADTDGSVASVEFFVNGVSKNTDAVAPYAYDWTSVAGNTELTAVATDNKGAKTTSSKVIFVVKAPVGILESAAAETAFSVYPNPAKDELSLEISSSENNSGSYSISGIDGKVVLRKELGFVSGTLVEKIDISSLARGHYIIGLTRNGNTSYKKILKN